jgi:RNA polymerase sigma-70 factor (ECF subfamily)
LRRRETHRAPAPYGSVGKDKLARLLKELGGPERTGGAEMRLDETRRKADGVSAVDPSDDSALLARAQAGDVTGFEGLVEKHKDRAYALALRMLNSEADAAEVTQESFLAAFRNLKEFRGDAQFTSWVHRITANFALMRLRKRKAAAETLESTLEAEPSFNERGSLIDAVTDWRNAEGDALDAELRTAIEQAAASLGDEYRQVFVLRDLEGLSYEEIATLTGVSVAAIKSRLHRARLSLRAAIDRFYEDHDA